LFCETREKHGGRAGEVFRVFTSLEYGIPAHPFCRVSKREYLYKEAARREDFRVLISRHGSPEIFAFYSPRLSCGNIDTKRSLENFNRVELKSRPHLLR
jgi:hypothetical protein